MFVRTSQSLIHSLGREKCDGIKPTCGTCAFSERGCTYDTQAKKRGIQPGYIRSLELSLAWLFSKHPDAENTLKRELSIENSPVQKLFSSKEGSESDRLHNRWSKGIICKQIDQLLSGAEVSSPSQFIPEGVFDGTDDILADLFPTNEDGLRTHGTTGDNALLSNVSLPSPSASRNTPAMRVLPDSSADEPMDGLLHLPADFWRLLDVYYSFIHAWLPISEKHDILKAAYSYPSEGFRILPSEVGSGNHSELWAIFALASHQINPRKQQEDIDLCITTARMLIPDVSGAFELGHARALILLSLIHIGRGDRTSAWMLVGSAVRISLELRLHERADSPLPRRKHVFLACYVVEAILGRLHSMPTHLKGYMPNVKDRVEEDGLEEWNPWDGGSNASPQQGYGLSRIPAQSMSIFNRLLATLHDEEDHLTASGGYPKASISASGTTDPTKHVEARRSSRNLQSGGTDSNAWTPQQLNLEVIQLWLRSERNPAGAKELWPTFTQKLKIYTHCFGASKIPPIAVPLLERLVCLLDLDVKEVALRNMIGSLTHVWRREVPIQAIAFQATPGQDASPASILGDPTISSYRHNSNIGAQALHPMNPPPTYNGSFGVDPGNFGSFAPGTESLTSHPLALQPNLPRDVNIAPTSNSMPPSLQQQGISSVPALDYTSQEQSQTADLEAIFEEIAMLDGTRQAGDRPEFMRNLGLGPDLDLSAFFGADYQPSDPLFSYLQPDSYGNDNSHSDMFPGG